MPKKQKKTNQWALAHEKNNSARSPQIEYVPAISEIKAPKGYMTVSISQAMMEYANPIMEYFSKGIVKDMNATYSIAMRLWNFTIERKRSGGDAERNDIISLITHTLKLNRKESTDLFDMMVQRKETLLPSDIQPENPRFMYLKKEKLVSIQEFDYSSLNIFTSKIPVDSADPGLVDLIDQMDIYIIKDAEYGVWEKFYLDLEEECMAEFTVWLREKKIQKDYIEEFALCLEVFMNFIYRYGHDDITLLKLIKPIYLEEFFLDHILRKVSMEPQEYIYFPPAIKAFYRFLVEKGYMRNSGLITDNIDAIEPVYVSMLKERFE